MVYLTIFKRCTNTKSLGQFAIFGYCVMVIFTILLYTTIAIYNYDAREAITCLQWACAYINHGRFEDAEQALKAAKKHWEALA